VHTKQMHPLLLEMKATLMFQQMRHIDAFINFISLTSSPHNAKTGDVTDSESASESDRILHFS